MGKRTIADSIFLITKWFPRAYFLIIYTEWMKVNRSQRATCVTIRGNITSWAHLISARVLLLGRFCFRLQGLRNITHDLGTFDDHFLPMQKSQHWLGPFNFDVQILHSKSLVGSGVSLVLVILCRVCVKLL